jgi:hypothetical protein
MPGGNNNGGAAATAGDRRRSQRFPLQLAVRYRSIGSPFGSEWTLGESVNISSSGLLLTTPEAATPGQKVEAFIAWPVFLDNRIPLKLVIKGRIVRSSGDLAAMCFDTYEFRTCQTPSEFEPHLARPVNPSATI